VAASYARGPPEIPPDRQILTYGLPRADRYGLSFYLHRELQEWTLMNGRMRGSLQTMQAKSD